jgi:Family of unknown function (DUF5723)
MFLRIFVFVFFCTASIGQCQHWLGYSSSNFAGTNSLFLNPAAVVDSRFKLYVNLAGNDFFTVNNYITYNAPYSILGLLTNTVSNKYRSERGLIIWKDSYYAETLNGKPKHLHAGGDVRGPSLMYSFKNRKYAIGLTTRGRYQLDMTNVSEETARVIRYGTDPIELQNVPFKNQSAMLTNNGFLEMGLTFGAVLKDDDEDFWKVGISVKRLVGLTNTHASLFDTDYTIVPVPNVPDREIIEAERLNGYYGYTTDEGLNFKPTPSWLFGSAPAGSGWGFDLGVVYEYRPDIHGFMMNMGKPGRRASDPNQNKYKYRISAAITDIGVIQYKNSDLVRQIDVNRENITFSYASFDAQNTISKATKALNYTLSVRAYENQKAFTIGLPTAFNVSFDYLLKKNWYVNTRVVQRLGSYDNINVKAQSVLAVTPRYERKWFEVAVPVSIFDNYSNFAVGLGARLGPLVVGSDNLGGLLSIGKPRGLDFYFNLYLPIFHAKPQNPNKCFYPPYEKVKKK